MNSTNEIETITCQDLGLNNLTEMILSLVLEAQPKLIPGKTYTMQDMLDLVCKFNFTEYGFSKAEQGFFKVVSLVSAPVKN